MPKVSVVLPAYNAEVFIRETIASICAQSFTDFEIIVVDDGSVDATAVIAAALDPRVRVVQQRNQGIATARNVGVAHAKGEWIAFMDHDDLWHPGKLQAQCKLLEQDPGCGIVYGEFLRWNPRVPPGFPDETIDSGRIVPDLSGFVLAKLVQTNWVLLSTAVIRRSVFDKVGYFDPTMPPADDWDFVLRAAEHVRFTKLEQPLVLYRVHPGQTSLKLTSRNVEFELRCRALVRLTALNVTVFDREDVRQRQFRALFNYGVLQYRAGLYRQASETFHTALAYRPLAGRTMLYLGASWLRSFLTKGV